MRPHPPIIAIFVSFVITYFLNSWGLLPIAERQLYDLFLRSRPFEAQDKSIVIVELSEKDLEKYGFPISDKTLAQILLKIKDNNPSVIGLDLHRNVASGEGKQELKEVFISTNNLIGVEKTDGGNPQIESISAPIELKQTGRTGASQIIEDSGNGVVRRGYLYVNTSAQEAPLPSLGLAVALKYLKNQGVSPEGYGQKNWLKLKEAIFPAIEANYFYESVQIDGYQVLINYRFSKFKQITISEVLENKVPANFFQNKIVFVGSMAETVDDIYLTPLSRNSPEFTYGVEIHAQLASQVINAALNQRVIIKSPLILVQYIYILAGLVIITYLSWYLFVKILNRNKQAILYLIYSCLSLSLILVSGYLLLLFGWWIPTVSIFGVCLISEIVIYIFVLENTLKNSQQKLEEARQKILLQEKLAVYDKSAKLIAHESKNKINILQSTIDLAQVNFQELSSFVNDLLFLFEVEDESIARELIENLSDELGTIKKETQKMNSMLERFYTGVSNRSINSQSISCNLIRSLNSIILNLKEEYRARYPEREIIIKRNYNLSENLESTEIPLEIEFTLSNLIENAFYHMFRKNRTDSWIPTLEITISSQENCLEIRIKDNGVGIAPSNIDKIFTDFWTTKSVGEGMGLGLYIAKESVEKYQGSIRVSSVEGEYTEFIVKLPQSIYSADDASRI